MKRSRGHLQRPRGVAHGFTLLEIVIVLALAAVLIGGAIGMMMTTDSERHLRNAAGDIEVLAKRARTLAMLQQTPYALVIGADGVHMMPFAEAVQPPDTAVGKVDDKTIVADNPKTTPVHGDWVAQENDVLSVKRWASDNFVPATDKDKQIWRFDTNGVCEPLTIHLQWKNSFIETEFHPLTAAVHNTVMEANK